MPEPIPVDPMHVSAVDSALTNGTQELTIRMTFGELFLYHCLLQDYGLALLGDREDRFIPLMERNAKRIKERGGK